MLRGMPLGAGLYYCIVTSLLQASAVHFRHYMTVISDLFYFYV